ncbi:MAG: V-type ATP synthase subunit E family protein [Polyangiales bacterium]
MAASDLDTELRRAAEQTAESILSAARTDSERVVSETERSVEGIRRERMDHKEAEYGADARRAVAFERHAAMRAVLLSRTRVVDRVLEQAKALLPEAAKAESYLSTLGAELGEALKFVEEDDALVRCSAALEPAVRKALRTKPQVQVEPWSETDTGFTVLGARASVLVDGRLETRIDRLASSLAIEIHARLQEL